MAKDTTADAYQDGPDDLIEEVEHPHCGHRNHEEKRAFNAHIGEGLMQTLEDSVCPSWLRLHVCYRPLSVLAVMGG